MVIRRRRRRARRLRRFRRPYRRTRRARRFRSRRSSSRRRRYSYARRRRFFQRRGYKVATSRWKVGGSLVRSYKFYVTKELLNRSDGTLGNVVQNNEWLPSILSIIDAGTLPQNVDGWTGAGNMISVYGLDGIAQRALGYDNYTIINMSFPGLFWLQYLGFFNNQEELIHNDLLKYSYYKPRSISVKFIPRTRPPPSKNTFFVPNTVSQSQADRGVYLSTAGDFKLRASGIISGTPTNTAWTAASGVASTGVNPLQFSNPDHIHLQPYGANYYHLSGYSTHEIWDHDADSLIGYIIPAASQASVVNNSPLPAWWENGVLAHLKGNMPNQFLSSFRKAPYSRSYISNTKPTTFIARFPDSENCAQFKHDPAGVTVYDTTNPPTVAHNNSMYDVQGAGPSPFSQTIPRSNGFIPAQLGSYFFQRTWPAEEDQNPIDARYNAQKISYPLYMPYENFNLFIPGIDLTSLLNRFRIQFSYKLWYSGKSFDLT